MEDFSLLGPARTPRNIEVIARPYPLRSSAEPTLLSFDIDSKNAVIGLSGEIIRDSPTLIYVPYHYHYSPSFRVWATSNKMEWDKANQLMYWYPSPNETENHIIFSKSEKLDTKSLPKKLETLLTKTEFVGTFT
jgi:hypothetical protein